MTQLLRFGHEQLPTGNSELAADWLQGYLRHYAGEVAVQAPFIRRHFLSSRRTTHTRFLRELQRRLVIAERTRPQAAFIRSLSSPLRAAMIVSADPVAHV